MPGQHLDNAVCLPSWWSCCCLGKDLAELSRSDRHLTSACAQPLELCHMPTEHLPSNNSQRPNNTMPSLSWPWRANICLGPDVKCHECHKRLLCNHCHEPLLGHMIPATGGNEPKVETPCCRSHQEHVVEWHLLSMLAVIYVKRCAC